MSDIVASTPRTAPLASHLGSIGLRIAGSILSAALMIVAFPGNAFPLMVWICLVPWLIALRNTSAFTGAMHGVLFSGIVWLIYLWSSFYDPATTIARSPATAAMLTAIHLLSYMIPFVVFAIIHKRFDDLSLKAAVTLASVLTLLTFVTPTLFDFNLGSFLYEHPLPLQALDLSGTSLLLWAIVLANILLRNLVVIAWNRWRAGRGQQPDAAPANGVPNAVALLVLVAAVTGYGMWRLADADDTRSSTGLPGSPAVLRIASIQPNMGPAMRPLAVVRDSKQSAAYSHVELTRKAIRDHGVADVVVWPENGMAVPCDDARLEPRIAEFAASIAIPVMHQCNDCASNPAGCYNQSRYVDATGATAWRHDKRNLMPFFERIPAAARNILKGAIADDALYLSGRQQSPLFRHDKALIIPAICFDAQSEDLVRAGLEQGGQVLIVQSNDRIFKQSKIGLFDLAINVSLAVAMRVPMAKVSNSGYGAFLQSDGRLVPGSITPVNTVMSSVHALDLRPRNSLYRIYGNWFIWVAAAIVLLAAVTHRRSDANSA
jgi:apolipoprotein N-acyltransferase